VRPASPDGDGEVAKKGIKYSCVHAGIPEWLGHSGIRVSNGPERDPKPAVGTEVGAGPFPWPLGSSLAGRDFFSAVLFVHPGHRVLVAMEGLSRQNATCSIARRMNGHLMHLAFCA